jgi:hypothetical protein
LQYGHLTRSYLIALPWSAQASVRTHYNKK